MLGDAHAPVVITQRDLVAAIAGDPSRSLVLDESGKALRATVPPPPHSRTASTHLAYVMYNVRLNGPRRKGHVLRIGCSASGTQHLTTPTSAPTRHSSNSAQISFDAASLESGGRCSKRPQLSLLYPPELTLAGGARRGDSIAWDHHAVGSRQASSIRWSTNQLESLLGVRQLMSGGDVLSVAHCPACSNHARMARSSRLRPHRMHDLHVLLSDDQGGPLGDTVSIGRPIANARVLHPRSAHAPRARRRPGELYIGGDGVARGYLNSPELTRECFISGSVSSDSEARLYKTGDRVRYLPDGRIEFLGRIDFQVKLRGFRIELGEIETAIRSYEGITEVLVVVHETRPRVSGLPPTSSPIQNLKSRHCAHTFKNGSRLYDPGRLCGSRCVPLTPNGKVDRRALPAPEDVGDAKVHAEPRPRKSGNSWRCGKELLHVKPIGIDDDFFELGGHSILAMTLIHRIEKMFDVRLPLTALFQATTIRRLAEALGERTRYKPSRRSSRFKSGVRGAVLLRARHPRRGPVATPV